MKKYKLWIEIEEIDEENDTYVDMTQSGHAEPVPLVEFDNLEAASAMAEAFGATIRRAYEEEECQDYAVVRRPDGQDSSGHNPRGSGRRRRQKRQGKSAGKEKV